MILRTLIKEKNSSFQRSEKELDYFFIFMPKDLFYKSPYIIQCIQEKNIRATTLVDNSITGYGFIDKKLMETVCQILEIKLQRLIKPK